MQFIEVKEYIRMASMSEGISGDITLVGWALRHVWSILNKVKVNQFVTVSYKHQNIKGRWRAHICKILG
jgi:hypothetical protein